MVVSSEDATLAILTFRVGPFLLGVEADQIAELTRPSSQRPSSHRGEGASDLKVMDLRSVCGLPRETAEEQRQLLVVNQAGEKVGYRVDQIGELITVNIAMYIWPLPPLLEIQKRWRQLWGVCQWENELVLLVDLQYQPQNEPKEG
jgi:chemotaxis signal transduction protein